MKENKAHKILLFRTDANRKIGSGHLVRCEIIADHVARHYSSKIGFIYRDIPDKTRERLESKGFELFALVEPKTKELEETFAILSNNKGAIIVVDGDDDLFYTSEYQLSIKEIASKLVMITFYSDTHFYADIIHNQNVRAKTLTYDCEPYTQKLLGPKYVVLKDEFSELAGKPEVFKKQHPPKTAMITFGGTDEPDRTGFTYRALLELSNYLETIIIVVGEMYAHTEDLVEMTETAAITTEFYQNTPNMPELMARCDMAITSGGLTAWELGVLGVLNIIIPFSDREITTAKYIDQEELAYFVPWNSLKNENDLACAVQDFLKQDYRARTSAMKKLMNANGKALLVEKIME